jgi:glycine cleavage system H lipoate-binding protein
VSDLSLKKDIRAQTKKTTKTQIYLCHISRIYLFGISDFSNSFVGDCVHFRTPRVDTRVGKAWGDGPSLRLANGEESA